MATSVLRDPCGRGRTFRHRACAVVGVAEDMAWERPSQWSQKGFSRHCGGRAHRRFQESRAHSWNPTNAANRRSWCALATVVHAQDFPEDYGWPPKRSVSEIVARFQER